ncbi:MAG: cobyrinate a,c-diamide synthase [Gammaproteobacteria bacterium]|nr:cobyrinate a,c-diamide synthase [Gammaproteobacteria bacterium]
MTIIKQHRCPALLISAPASGQGKTTFTAALARYHRNQGRTVRVFKTGPDFLDPMILEQASGNPVYQLDLWMVGEQACKQQLYEAAAEADLILIEGVMGLFDGTPSSADLAELFGIPVLALIDTSAMAQTFGAIAHGLAHYRSELPFAGVIANRVASDGHADMLAESVSDGIHFYGSLKRDENITLPDRHLGLFQAGEIEDLETRLEQAAALISNTDLKDLPASVTFELNTTGTQVKYLLKNIKIGIAKDEAFSFIYPANIDTLKQMGAEFIFFSPLKDKTLPEVDCLWLPGGYPELHLKTLQNNNSMRESIKQHHANNKAILAECGGMLYLLNTLTDKENNRSEMVGIIDGDGMMQQNLVGLGMQEVELNNGKVTAHTFHHSSMRTTLEPITHGIRQRGKRPGEAVYKDKQLTASYLHLYFASNPKIIAQLFKAKIKL